MANDIYKQAGDKTPFAPLLSTPVDADPDYTLNGPRPFAGSPNWPSLGAQGGRTNRENQASRASDQASAATFREQTGRNPGDPVKSKRLKASKRKRGK